MRPPRAAALPPSCPSALLSCPGLRIAVVGVELKGARSMALSPGGILYVGTKGPGVVYACKMQPDSTYAIAATLRGFGKWPNGVAFIGNDLYVSEMGRVVRLPNIDATLESPKMEVVIGNLPTWEHTAGAASPPGLTAVFIWASARLQRVRERFAICQHRQLHAPGQGHAHRGQGRAQHAGHRLPPPAQDDVVYRERARQALGHHPPRRA